MIPRGEVGLIFANIGLGLSVGGEPVVDSGDLLGGGHHGDRDDHRDAPGAQVEPCSWDGEADFAARSSWRLAELITAPAVCEMRSGAH